MRHALRTILALLFAGWILISKIPVADAYVTPHPLQDYEQGLHFLNAYRGNADGLYQANLLFSRIIEKHPTSPLGYLGISQLKIIEAYRYEQHYNIKIISDEALPMALKAMHNGPTLITVHENYDRFEKILSRNDAYQEEVKKLLLSSPENSQTYFALADYLCDQGEFQKALEYYTISLRLTFDDSGKLKALQRIAGIYLEQLHDAKSAVEYYEQALRINPNMPNIWQALGSAYFKLKEYELSVKNFKKALDVFNTKQLSDCLSQAQGLARKKSTENNQNTSLHCQSANLYYQQDLSQNKNYPQGLSSVLGD